MNFDQLFKVIKEIKQNNAYGDTVDLSMWASGCNDCEETDCNLICKRKDRSSEIEKMFCMAFMHQCQIENINDCPFHIEHNPFDRQFRIQREFEIGNYRCDFLCEYEVFINNKYRVSSVIVELDSQKWHETTESQRRYEKKRERFIQSMGFNILRFTGKEIMDDPIACSIEVERFLRDNLKVAKK